MYVVAFVEPDLVGPCRDSCYDVEMAKVVYTIVFYVAPTGVKVNAPAWPNVHFGSGLRPESEAGWSEYIDAFRRVLSQVQDRFPSRRAKDFCIQHVFIDVSENPSIEAAPNSGA